MQHLKALDRRAINLFGESFGKTMPLRMKKVCLFNVSTNSIYGFNLRGPFAINRNLTVSGKSFVNIYSPILYGINCNGHII